jgi:2-polyprenyl-3-methyl-5-hydroxy-6-metoxy-1,4-benzoquinol methylase
MDDPKFKAGYTGNRRDVESLLLPTTKNILDVGCSVGTLGSSIKKKFKARAVGIELSPEMAKVAASQMDEVFIGGATEVLSAGKLIGQQFDTIIFADVLEHLQDPWGTLKKSVIYLEPNGVVIASIPNIRFVSTLFNLAIKGYWPYRDRGTHDRTHLRFFTKRNIYELFANADLSIEAVKVNYRIIEKPHGINRFAKYLAFPGIKGFLAYQYLIRARQIQK